MGYLSDSSVVFFPSQVFAGFRASFPSCGLFRCGEGVGRGGGVGLLSIQRLSWRVLTVRFSSGGLGFLDEFLGDA